MPLVMRPASGQTQLGGFVASASAQALRASFDADGFLIVRSLFDGGGPVSQAVVNSVDAQSFASLPYPGETTLSGPGLIAANGGPTLPEYPLYVSASPTKPEAQFADPSGAYLLSARASSTEASGEARSGQPDEKALASGAQTLASAVVSGDTVTATARSTIRGLSLAEGALRIGTIRSHSVTTLVAGSAGRRTEAALIVEGGRAGEVTFAYGPEGLTVASGGGIPVPTGQGLAVINQALAPAGVSVALVATDDAPGGTSSDVLEVAQRGELPTGGQGVIRLRFGGTSTGVVSGGGEDPLTVPFPDMPADPVAEAPAAPAGGGPAPAVPPAPVSGPSVEPVPSRPVVASPLPHAEYPAPSLPAVSSPTAPSGEGSSAPPVPEGQTAVDQPILSFRESDSMGIGYVVLVVGAVLMFVVGSIWRRGALTP